MALENIIGRGKQPRKFTIPGTEPLKQAAPAKPEAEEPAEPKDAPEEGGEPAVQQLAEACLEAGLRFLTDQENWDDQPMFTGFSKRYLQVKKDFLTARVGTYYSTLGRGLVLNCANELAAKIDRDLEGATAAVSLDNIGDARFLMGRIRENTREIDTSKTYVGGEVKLNRLAFAVVGGTYLRANAALPDGPAALARR